MLHFLSQNKNLLFFLFFATFLSFNNYILYFIEFADFEELSAVRIICIQTSDSYYALDSPLGLVITVTLAENRLCPKAKAADFTASVSE